MEYVMSMYRNKDDMISDMRAEITQLRAELEQERELADRLAGIAERAQHTLKQVLAGKPVRDADEIIASVSALTAHATRINK